MKDKYVVCSYELNLEIPQYDIKWESLLDELHQVGYDISGTVKATLKANIEPVHISEYHFEWNGLNGYTIMKRKR